MAGLVQLNQDLRLERIRASRGESPEQQSQQAGLLAPLLEQFGGETAQQLGGALLSQSPQARQVGAEQLSGLLRQRQSPESRQAALPLPQAQQLTQERALFPIRENLAKAQLEGQTLSNRAAQAALGGGVPLSLNDRVDFGGQITSLRTGMAALNDIASVIEQTNPLDVQLDPELKGQVQAAVIQAIPALNEILNLGALRESEREFIEGIIGNPDSFMSSLFVRDAVTINKMNRLAEGAAAKLRNLGLQPELRAAFGDETFAVPISRFAPPPGTQPVQVNRQASPELIEQNLRSLSGARFGGL